MKKKKKNPWSLDHSSVGNQLAVSDSNPFPSSSYLVLLFVMNDFMNMYVNTLPAHPTFKQP